MCGDEKGKESVVMGEVGESGEECGSTKLWRVRMSGRPHVSALEVPHCVVVVEVGRGCACNKLLAFLVTFAERDTSVWASGSGRKRRFARAGLARFGDVGVGNCVHQ